MNNDVEKYPGTLYDYTAGALCGVLVTERVMKKLARLQADHLDAVKRLLHDNSEDVFPSSWTLHYPDGVQTALRYITPPDMIYGDDVKACIKNATHASQPKPCYPVYIPKNFNEAQSLRGEKP